MHAFVDQVAKLAPPLEAELEECCHRHLQVVVHVHTSVDFCGPAADTPGRITSQLLVVHLPKSTMNDADSAEISRH